jgi:CDP-glycerol glycerophosphotransferase (TagB/SpsB family)
MSVVMRKFLNYLLKPVDRVMQVGIPSSSRRVTYFSKPDYSDNTYYLYRHVLLKRSGIEHVWLVENKVVADNIYSEFESLGASKAGHKLKVVSKASFHGYLLYLQSRFLFHSHGVYAFSNWAFRRHVVSLWHGMPIKCVGRLNFITPNPYPTFGTLFVATSSFFKYIMACAFNAAPAQVLVCGLPLCEVLRAGCRASNEASKILRKLGMNAEDKFVLWMPTYRSEVSHDTFRGGDHQSFLDDLPRELIDAVDRAAEAAGCKVIVKLHPRDVLNGYDVPIRYKNITLFASQEWLDMGAHLYDVLALSDALISDVSSVLIDYLATKKPIAVMGFDEKNYIRDLTFPIEVLRGSSRYQWLQCDEDVRVFFESVKRGEQHVLPPGDVSKLLYDDVACVDSSEQILRAVGL